MSDFRAVINDFPFTGFIDAGDEIKDRRLSCPVWPHHAEDLPFLDVEGEVVDCGQAPKGLR